MKKVLNRYTCDSNAYLSRMPAGIPGDISRKEGAYVEARVYDATNPPLAYAQPVTIDGTSKNMRAVASTTVSADIYGFLARPYPTSNINTTDGLGASAPNTNQPADIIKKGYFSALLYGATAAALNGQVYTRIANTDSTHPLGGLEAAGSAAVTSPAIVGTGTGTIVATIGDATKIKKGTYSLVLQTTSNTSKVTVIDPDGFRLPDATVGSAYSQEGLNFTITAAGTMTAGDAFSPVVSFNTIPVPNAVFTGPADSAGNVEVAYKI